MINKELYFNNYCFGCMFNFHSSLFISSNKLQFIIIEFFFWLIDILLLSLRLYLIFKYQRKKGTNFNNKDNLIYSLVLSRVNFLFYLLRLMNEMMEIILIVKFQNRIVYYLIFLLGKQLINRSQFIFELSQWLKEEILFHKLNNSIFNPPKEKILHLQNKLCLICRNDLNSNSKQLICGHYFHYKCITTWIIYNTTCPICRKSLITNYRKEKQDNEKDKKHYSALYFKVKNWLNIKLLKFANWLFMNKVIQDYQNYRKVPSNFGKGIGGRMNEFPAVNFLNNQAQIVKKNFPNIPMDSIISDLMITRNAETTIIRLSRQSSDIK
ncbi:zinc ring finger protein [Anaeramoeba flamelloides]|uniref:Zinc ring finger protein n=1 Tax=Anaeramoeba flamelloides TaxID=1746091 RepID=A0ABQ8X9M3_9EUKA|nr:zinc ring finger protein [Anaeramoeba flamelloides]